MIALRLFLLLWAALAALLTACGGGGSPEPAGRVVSNAAVGSAMVYADGAWAYPDPTGKWMIRGTLEDDAFMPAKPVGWYLPADGPSNTRPWWTLTQTPAGLLNSASPPGGHEYSGSFVNDAFTRRVYVSARPVISLDYEITAFEGSKARATLGVSLRYPDGSEYYLERDIKLAGPWASCPNGAFNRCISNITYFPPASGPMDVRALLLQSPGMTPEKADAMSIAGVYIGSEIYGAGRVDILIKHYDVRTR